MALVGNKVDLDERREVNSEEAQDYADANDLLFMETSAKTGFNVSDLFLGICMYLSFSSFRT